VAASIVNVRDVNHVSQFTKEFKQEPAHATVNARNPATRDSAPDKPSFKLQALHLAAHRSAQAGIADFTLRFPQFMAALNRELPPAHSTSRRDPYYADNIARHLVDQRESLQNSCDLMAQLQGISTQPSCGCMTNGKYKGPSPSFVTISSKKYFLGKRQHCFCSWGEYE
jgi:hypothetical protein